MFNDPTFVKNFAEMVKKLNIKTALEVGCLSGELRDVLRGIGIKCDGIDLHPRLPDVIKGDFMTHNFDHYDLVFGSGVLEHYTREQAKAMIDRMATIGDLALNFVPNAECQGYMKAKSKTKAEWRSEIPYTLKELLEYHSDMEVVDSGYQGYEWSKRFGGNGSQPYLVWAIARKIEEPEEIAKPVETIIDEQEISEVEEVAKKPKRRRKSK